MDNVNEKNYQRKNNFLRIKIINQRAVLKSSALLGGIIMKAKTTARYFSRFISDSKPNSIKIVLLLIICTFSVSYGQQRIPKEYILPSGKISFSSIMPITQAIQALSEISSRLEKKVIIDEKIRSEAINVEIVDLEWRDALELILKINNLEYEEYPNYIKIVDRVEEVLEEEEREYNSTMREVNISAIFFEGDKHVLREKGINWEALIKRTYEIGDVTYDIRQNLVGQPVESDIFRVGVTMETTDETLSGLLKALETDAVGEVLASPNIQVLEGDVGSVQIGHDFSVKQLDFAGNVTDVFRSTGIILRVTPMVIQEDSLYFIHLEVQAERSSVTPGAVSTIIKKSMANTSLFLLDGERAVIAGLYSTDEIVTRAGIPILKNLPWWVFGIRYLTGYESKEYNEKELVIIIKAELLPTLNDRELVKLNNIEYIESKREEIKKKFNVKK